MFKKKVLASLAAFIFLFAAVFGFGTQQAFADWSMISIHLTYADGSDAYGFRVTAWQDGNVGKTVYYGPGSCSTCAYYDFDLASGTYEFTADNTFFHYETITPNTYTLVDGDQKDFQISVGNPTDGAITGTVTDSMNVALAGKSVALSQNGTVLSTVTTDSNGQYTFPFLQAGSGYQVAINEAGFTAQDNLSVTNGVKTTANFKNSIATYGSISGSYLSKYGYPTFSYTTIDLYKGATKIKSIETSYYGDFSFDNLAAGNDYKVVAHGSSLLTQDNISVINGQTTKVTIIDPAR